VTDDSVHASFLMFPLVVKVSHGRRTPHVARTSHPTLRTRTPVPFDRFRRCLLRSWPRELRESVPARPFVELSDRPEQPDVVRVAVVLVSRRGGLGTEFLHEQHRLDPSASSVFLRRRFLFVCEQPDSV
jgi:hypothetical protein